MSGIQRTRADVVEPIEFGEHGDDRDRKANVVDESPEDFKGAPKSKRDRASQLVQQYGRHST